MEQDSMSSEGIYEKSMFDFVRQNMGSSVASLSLKFHGKDFPFPLEFALTQIECRRKSADKLSRFIEFPGFLFPSVSISEQSSNQNIACYHASLIGKGQRVADLTAGLGIDAFTAAMAGNDVTAVEIDPFRAEIMRWNMSVLGIASMTVVNRDCNDLINGTDARFDCVFIDPARRDSNDNRSFMLRHSSPDILPMLPYLGKITARTVIKASPLLDISQTVREIPDADKIEIVSYKGECKEVLVQISGASSGIGMEVSCVDIGDCDFSTVSPVPVVNYRFSTDMRSLTECSPVYCGIDDIKSGHYIYELGAGLRKLDCAGVICARYASMKSLSRNSGLFVSDTKHDGFPGRTMLIEHSLTGKEARQLKGERLRIVSHDHPEKADCIRKRYGISEGENRTLYATRLSNGKPFMFTAVNLS